MSNSFLKVSMQALYTKEVHKIPIVVSFPEETKRIFKIINRRLEAKTKAVQIKKSAMKIRLTVGNKRKPGKESKSKGKIPRTLQTLQTLQSTTKTESLKIGQKN